MKTALRITQNQSIEVEQKHNTTSIAITVGDLVELDCTQLEDLIQVLITCRDSRKRRSAK